MAGIFVDKPKGNTATWKALAPFIKSHYKTEMTLSEIVAELSYQEYLQSKPTLLTGFDVERIRNMRHFKDKP